MRTNEMIAFRHAADGNLCYGQRHTALGTAVASEYQAMRRPPKYKDAHCRTWNKANQAKAHGRPKYRRHDKDQPNHSNCQEAKHSAPTESAIKFRLRHGSFSFSYRPVEQYG